jgi:hypothetical protein
MMSLDRALCLEASGDTAADLFAAQLTASVDEYISDALPSGSSEEILLRLAALGLTKTVGRLRLALIDTPARISTNAEIPR